MSLGRKAIPTQLSVHSGSFEGSVTSTAPPLSCARFWAVKKVTPPASARPALTAARISVGPGTCMMLLSGMPSFLATSTML